ncbi:carbohydrate ABC transporter substrate-binding protein (CUT1 family) [Humitalea rosea]|uniref:Carbohydrate ABC transporter substrate-binding protein (CUT1 family) n=1 Tax=Humitalea rosea TaxID=990373 RepID=A0A2W7K076_9PROT|nr:extracellular solute-binding protein [Humitalea rosea]PZW41080.1 carbohydrate ABC transporter substrate-binding protein (CUT1 family) [Humitalea rosea]
MIRTTRRGALALGAATLAAPALAQTQVMVLDMPCYQLREGFGPWWHAAAEAFNQANDGLRVNLIEVPFEQHHQQLTTRFIANNPPDLCHISARFFYGFADQGFLEPLDRRLAAIGWKETDFIPAQRDMRRDGKVFAQLLLGYAYGLYYNAAMFEAAGIAPPRDLPQLLAAAKGLTRDRDGDGRTDQFGIAWPTANTSASYVYLTYLITGMGRDWVEGGKLLPREALQQALEVVQTLLRDRATPPGLDSNPARQLFWQGNAAMIIDGSWGVAYRKDSPDALKPALRVVPLPFRNQAAGPSNVLAIPADRPAARKDAAFRFLALIQSAEWQQKYGEIGGNPPARLGMLTDEARRRWPELPIFEKAAAESTGSFMPHGHEGDFNRWNAMVGEAVTAMVAGRIDAAAAAVELHRDLSSAFF